MSLKPIKLGQHTVPGIWRYMLPEDVMYFRVDPEIRANCFNCPKVKSAGFHPLVRCCTVIPRVPNFLLGFALMDGRDRVREVLKAGMILPEGLIIAPSALRRSLDYIIAPNPGLPKILCPFLGSDKQCQIYAFRNAVCTTFFCEHDRGTAGDSFWSSLGDLASQVESILAQWALEKVGGFDLDAYFAALADFAETDENWSPAARSRLFGDWFGREDELLLRTAEVVLDHKAELWTIASNYSPRSAKLYDKKLRTLLSLEFPADLISEALPEGEAESLASLWYQTQLSQRNLQLAPSPHVIK